MKRRLQSRPGLEVKSSKGQATQRAVPLPHTLRLASIVPPGLEGLAEAELRRSFAAIGIVGLDITSVDRGVLEWSVAQELWTPIKRRLRLPTRVLVRLGDFRATSFPQMHQRATRLLAEAPPCIDLSAAKVKPTGVAVERCRVRIKRRIADLTNGVLAEIQTMRSRISSQEAIQAAGVWVRGVDDVFSVSADLGGEFLFRRGLREWIGQAPIRENLAAACVQAVEAEALKIAPEAEWELVDPAAGAGTIVLEAAISGLAWPPMSSSPADRNGRPFWSMCRGVEDDQSAREALVHNFASLRLIWKLDREPAQIDSGSGHDSGRRIAVLMNLPYGDRIRVRGAEPGPGGRRRRYLDLLADWSRAHRASLVSAIIPREDASHLSQSRSIGHLLRELRFSNGGRPVSLLIWQCPSR